MADATGTIGEDARTKTSGNPPCGAVKIARTTTIVSLWEF